MNNLFDTIYSDMFVMIVASAFIAVMITSLTSILVKVNLSGYAIPLTSFIWFLFLYGPIPAPAQQALKKDLVFLKNNNVQTNAMINTIILSCSDALKGSYIKGYQYRDFREAYELDVNAFLESNKLFTHPLNSSQITKDPIYAESKNICDAAWMYNK
ncbi:hypothetical protein P4Q92_003910, partial [Acinetobacter baumannii]|nr:hypothetical protein [Acinetobacter baumannii]EKW2321780.1 hypothetical protein [Acinetobacter baumannii]